MADKNAHKFSRKITMFSFNTSILILIIFKSNFSEYLCMSF